MAAVLNHISEPATDRGNAMAALCNRLSPPLRRFFARYRLSPQDADDMTQEVLLRLAAPQGRAELRNVDAFVFTVARNLLRDRARRLYTRAAAASMSIEDVEIACRRPSPDEMCDLYERLERAAYVLDTLKPNTRRAFLRLRVQGLSHAQIAAEMGISVSMVEKHVMLALAALRTLED